ncbi:MAG: protein translocase subunit SecF [Acidobacteriota bacterium]
MQIFANTNYDFLGKKVPFIIFSLLLTAAGLISLAVHGGPRYGIDFKGGTLMYVKFANPPHEDEIRKALSDKIKGEISVQRIVGSNELMIGTEIAGEQQLEAERAQVRNTLAAKFGGVAEKPDFHSVGRAELTEALRTPMQNLGQNLSTEQLQDIATKMLAFRDTPPQSGLISNFDELKNAEGVPAQAIQALKSEFALSPFVIRSAEMVGPKIGAELRQQAIMATLFALGGMLIYIALRFEWIYGVAAVIAVFHDTIVTIGLFSIFGKEISLTVVAALLTLVGYSMNDTIVIFDRVRENVKSMRRESLSEIINLSVNQTLSRTVMASGLTFMTVLALWIFGGPVLNGFAFALVMGILVGTYSSVFVASPIVIWWHQRMSARHRSAAAASTAPRTGTEPRVKPDDKKVEKKEKTKTARK